MSERPGPREALWRHQEVRGGVRAKTHEIFGEGEISDEALDTFFLLEGETLSEEEKRDVALFVQHAGERLINAILNRPGQKITSPEEALRILNNPEERFGIIPLHDPAHCITTFERSEENSVVPAFFKHTTEEAFLNPHVTAEEFPALLWSRPIENMNIFTSLFEQESATRLFEVLRKRAVASSDPTRYSPMVDALEQELDSTNFESVRRIFEEFTILFLKTSSPGAIKPELIKKAEPFLDESVRTSQTNPDEKYLVFAQRLFNEYKTNKRIYIEEFERILKPLLERLRAKDDALRAVSASTPEQSQ